MTALHHRVGIFGGSFNPLHQGHLIVAEFAAESFDLDYVLFAPVLHPPHKDGSGMVAIGHRLKMIELAIASNARFKLSRVDIERPGPHYSVDTVKLIQDEYPTSQLYFVMGGDSLKSYPAWYKPMEIIQYARLAVMRRPSSRPVQPDMHDGLLPGLSDYVDMIEAPPIGISSTRVREQLSRGKSVRYLLPDAVLDYIHAHHLYQPSSEF
ncbi:MAG: nicotinate-nucleotide adenylyltransferase [Phototrophicaceae bacterium]